MATYYIAPTGDDTTGDGSEGNPWYNLNYAQNAVGDIDTIICKAGTYPTQEAIPQSQMNGIQILGETGDPRDVVLDFVGETFQWKNTGGSGANLTPSLQFITIKNASWSNPGSARGLFSSMGSGLTLNKCIFDYCGTGGDTSSTRGWGNIVTRILDLITITNCVFKDCFFWNGTQCGYWGGQQITNYEGTYIVKNNLFVTTGANAPVGAIIMNACIIGETYGNQQHINKNNIYYFNDAGAILKEENTYEVTTSKNNCYYNTDYAGVEVGTITDDPLLVDPANGDFRLRPGSPCVGGGTI